MNCAALFAVFAPLSWSQVVAPAAGPVPVVPAPSVTMEKLQAADGRDIFDGRARPRQGPLELISVERDVLLNERRVEGSHYVYDDFHGFPHHGHLYGMHDPYRDYGFHRTRHVYVPPHIERTYGTRETFRIVDRDEYATSEALKKGALGLGLGALAGALALLFGAGIAGLAGLAIAGAAIGGIAGWSMAKSKDEVFTTTTDVRTERLPLPPG